MNLLLRPPTEAVSVEAKSKTKKAFGIAAQRLQGLSAKQRNANEAFQKAQSAAHEFSDKNRKGLQDEIERRERNVLNLTVRRVEKNAEIRRNGLLLKKADEQAHPALEAKLKTLHLELEKLEAEIPTENDVIAELQRRLRSAVSPKKQKLVDTVFTQRKAELDTANQQVAGADAEYKRLEGILSDLQADLCQRELLEFIRGKRYGHTPRKLANGIAGLPTINCRQSAVRCAKIPYTWEPDYTIFEFVEKTWRRREPLQSKAQQVLNLFRNAIAALPRTLLGHPGQDGKRKRLDNYFRSDLCEKWFYLKQAIQDAVRAYTHPDQVPYLIEARFKENVSKPRTAADELIAAQDALTI